MPTARRLAGAVLGVALAGCGGASASRPAHAPAPRTVSATTTATTDPAASCALTVAATMRQIAARIYHQAAFGGGDSQAGFRLGRSAALADAVASGSASATRAALQPLLKQQIHRIVITRGSRALVSYGTSQALGPAQGVIRRGGVVVGRYTLSVSTDVSMGGITHSVTGAQIVMLAGGRVVMSTLPSVRASALRAGTVTLGGSTYSASVLHGTAYPSGPLRIWVLTPGSSCSTGRSATRVQTLGTVAERLFRSEATGVAVHRTLNHVARDQGFQAAVAHDDPAALRRAILRMFATHSLHVVRIRATDASGRLVNDVGGPYALAPASQEVVAADGRRLGTVTLSIQDDTGYIKLMHRFTGVDVLLRTPAGFQIPGSSLSPGPASIPDRGTVTYGGRAYGVYSFDAVAFLGTPLRVSLLIPPSAA